MFSIQPTDEQKAYATEQARTLAFGRRGTFDGDETRQRVGILGQTVMADLLGVPRPIAGRGHDGGVDFVIGGKSCDLKTMSLTYPPKAHWANNLYVGQINFLVDGYVFASIVKSQDERMYFHGVMSKQWLDIKKYFVAKGTPCPRDGAEPLILTVDTIVIPSNVLFQVSSFSDVVEAVALC